MVKKVTTPAAQVDTLYDNIVELIEQGRAKVASAVNLTMVYTNYEIGRYIIEQEQQGSERAQYGKAVLKELSLKLAEKYGSGYSVETLQKMRKLYLVYSKSAILSAPLTKSFESINEPIISKKSIDKKLSAPLTEFKFTLSWFHYMTLIRIENDDERRFYEIEATNNNWSGRYLERQYASSPFESILCFIAINSRRNVELIIRFLVNNECKLSDKLLYLNSNTIQKSSSCALLNRGLSLIS